MTVAETHDVGGFQVAMDDPSSVRLVQSRCDLNAESKYILQVQAALVQALCKGVAFEKLYHKEIDAVLVADVMKRAYVWVGQARFRLGFTFKPLLEFAIPSVMARP